MSVPSTELKTFGRTVRKLRRNLELSQEALASLAGLSPKHVGEIERANKDPRLTTVAKLARALDMRPGELMTTWDERLEQDSAAAATESRAGVV
jgi:transcriptional regulator with XRE-family HTH domain